MNKKLQAFGKTLLFPISLLSFMAIFLGLTSALSNETIIEMLPFLGNETLQDFFDFIHSLAAIAFTYLPVLFAMAIPMGMVKKNKEVAVYSSIVGYIALLVGMNAVLGFQGINADTMNVDELVKSGMSQTEASMEAASFKSVLGIFVYNMNIIGGMIAGLVTVWVHNKFQNTELPEFLSFYSGRRFVPIANLLILAFVGGILVFIWPIFDSIIIALGEVIASLGFFGVFLYGFFEKLLNPTGLHHILNETFRFTALGGTETINGETYVGALNIYFAELNQGVPFTEGATQYLAQGKILHMVFGMPAAVYAMYKTALPEKRDKVLKFFIPGLTAVVLTGITEPIEFTFIFISPLLYFVNAILAGISFMIPAMLGVTIGNIQGGIIDWFVFGVLQGMDTGWYYYLIVGPIMAVVYYFTFKTIIIKKNVKTLGRSESDFEDTNEEIEAALLNDDQMKIAETIVNGLGGIDNIEDVDNCISRLRVEVKDPSKIKEEVINQTHPMGIMRPTDTNIHIVYGGKVTKMRNIVDEYMLGQ